MQRRPRSQCDCGKPPLVAISRSAKNPDRPYATCVDWRSSRGCRYFQWLGPAAAAAAPAAAAGPATPEREAAVPRTAAASAPAVAAPPTRPTARCLSAQVFDAPAELPVGAASRTQAGPASCAAATHGNSQDGAECFAAFLFVRSGSNSAAPLLSGLPGAANTDLSLQREEWVELLLLPASPHPPAYCTQRLAAPQGERRLPRAPAALDSLQPPYVQLRHCPAAGGVWAALRHSAGGGLFVVDTETTGLSGRDYVHQLAALNLQSGQLLTVLLRTCPRGIGSAAAQVCGSSNQQIHDPRRPTFGQVAPLLWSFFSPGAASIVTNHITASNGTNHTTASSRSSSSSSPCSALAPSRALLAEAGTLSALSKSGTSGDSGSCGRRLPPFFGAARPGGVPSNPRLSPSTPLRPHELQQPPGQPEAPLLVAHNGGFDARMLIGECLRRGLGVPREWRLLDTLPWARQCLDGRLPNLKQETLRCHFGVMHAPGEAAHDAGTDVTVLAQLLPHLLRASGAAGLHSVLGMRKPSGLCFVRTFGEIQDGMRGAPSGAEDREADAAEAVQFVCPICQQRVVE